MRVSVIHTFLLLNSPTFSTCDVNDCIGLLCNKYEKRAVLPESHNPTSSTSRLVLRLFLHRTNNAEQHEYRHTTLRTRKYIFATYRRWRTGREAPPAVLWWENNRYPDPCQRWWTTWFATAVISISAKQ